MSLRWVILLVVGIVIVVFVGSNWSAVTAPTDVSLLVTSFRAPLGLILLGLMVLLCALFGVFVTYLQGSALLETRRHARELAAQHELAEQAETSRITELRGYLEEQITRLSAVQENQTREVLARLERAEASLREHPAQADAQSGSLAPAVEALGRTLQARIDRLEMGLRDEMKGKSG
jgi:uncharacterized integral membrane protein